MRRAPRADKNQPEIVAALRKVGAVVQHLHGVGEGCPDLMVGKFGRTYLMEVKMPGEWPNALQAAWIERWRGAKVHVVHSVEEALAVIRA